MAVIACHFVRMKKRFILLAAAVLSTIAAQGADSKNGPTPFPDSKDEAAWPGKGPVRTFGWMVDNRNWFWTQREKDQGAMVFAGDSLTGNWKLDLMQQLFPGLKIANRGIGGDVSRGLLFRFQEDVLDLHPKAIVILIGANDLSAHANPADAESNIAAIIEMARKQDPNVPIVLCQTAPRDSAEAPTKPGAQADLNSRIAKLGAGKDKLVVLDLFPALVDANGKPVPECYEKDKLHLAPPGYVKWAELIRPAFRKLGIEVADPDPASIKLPPPKKEETKPAAKPASSAKGLSLSMSEGGIAIDAGALGAFTISYPQLIDDSQKSLHKLIEKKAAGKTATIKYDGGAEIVFSITGSDVKMKFVNMPADTKKYMMDILIDPSFAKGGTWKIGERTEAFPREKPANPHLFQGNANDFRLANAMGEALTLKIPDYSYEELNDNREWGWTIFALKFIAIIDPNNPEATITIGGEKAAGATPAELKAGEKGIAISAGSIGEFELEYPVLRNEAQQPVHKKIEAKASGRTATVKYEDGAQVAVAIEGSDVEMKFSNVPGDVKSYEATMLIVIGFNKGGKWKIGDTTGEFPREKPAKPHLFQGNQTSFLLTNPQGLSLSIRTPDWAYQQLTDNREWNWPIFAWRFTAPFNPDNPNGKISFATGGGAVKNLVDQFGQSVADNFPNKVKSLDELKADVAGEKAYFDSLRPPEFDRFGGLPGSGEKIGLKKTGFFHVEQHGEKTWMVDPDGNAFFHFGVCSFGPGEDYTYIKGRENIYEWLPSPGSEFATAFREGSSENFSFHLANTIRKYGQPYSKVDYTQRMIDRVRKWGFNSVGAFSSIPDGVAKARNFPYVSGLPLSEWEGLPRVPGVFESFDPFDEKTRAKIEENIAKHVPAKADDPLLIGYFIVNEPRFDEIPKNVPALNGKHGCKRKLVAMLAEKYKTIEAFNAAWEAQAKSFDELNDAGLAVKNDAARKDMSDYTGLYLDAYFSVVNDSFRKHDNNHMLLGARYQPVTINNEQLCRITGKYCEIMSFNYYTYGIDKTLLKNVYEWSGKRPIMLSEFFWSSLRDSGLAGGRDVSSQQQRGLAYRNYVEQSASLGFVIGIEWFTLIDQATTGRWFSKYNGESANTGLFSVGDRPWKECVGEMAKTNYEVYDVLLGTRPPFAWDDARVK